PLLQYGDAVDARQTEIQNDRIELARLARVQRVHTIVDNIDGVGSLTQRLSQLGSERPLVLNDQDPHLASSPRTPLALSSALALQDAAIASIDLEFHDRATCCQQLDLVDPAAGFPFELDLDHLPWRIALHPFEDGLQRH